MKILAIRGKNLASLGGDFAVELGSPPLSHTGIFAISGPTGSGKTTLLDAMCLALFDRTPRLNDRGGVRVGLPGEDDALWVASQDVRSLLRKGCSSGAAEVDFLGRDGRVYRARWTVRRARDRADGQLQAQVMTLQVLETGELIGRTKSDVLSAIEARLGLSFEQFRRSALLAQGDFAAFLKAGERERAELLEQMTGTGLYGQLSVQAHERSKLESKKLDLLQERLGVVQLLSPQERETLGFALENAVREAEEARLCLLAAESALAWKRQHSLLQEQERDANRLAEEARRVWDSSAPERAVQERTEALLPLVPMLASVQRQEQSVAGVRAQVTLLARSLEDARQRALEVASERTLARTSLVQRRDALSAAEPELSRAAVLDTEILAVQRGGSQISAEVASLQAAQRDASRAAEALSESVHKLHRDRQQAEDALKEMARVSLVAAEWPRWRSLLRSYFVASRDLAAQDRGGKKNALALARELAAACLLTLAALEDKVVRAEVMVREAEEKASSFDATELRRRRDWLLAQQHRLSQLARATEEAQSLAEAHQAATDAIELARQDRELWAKKAQNAARQREQFDRSLQEAQRALELATAALDLSARRALLSPGEHCPLCGAKEHPWASEAPELDRLVHSQRERVDYLKLTRQNADREEISAKGRMQELRARIEQESTKAQKLSEQAEALRLHWAHLRAEVALDALPTDPAAASAHPAVVEAERAIEAALGEARAEEQLMDDAAQAVNKARRLLDGSRSETESARREAEKARAEVEAASQALQRAEELVERRRAEQAAILEELTPAFSSWDGWREELTGDVGAFGQLCAGEVQKFHTFETSLRGATEALASAEGELQVARARVAERGGLLAEREEALGALQRQLEALREQRAQLLGGATTEQTRASLLKQISEAEEQERTTVERHEAQERALASLESKHEGSSQQLLALEGELEVSSKALRDRMEEQNISREELESAGGKAEWARAEHRRLEGLREAAERASVIAEERRARREEHERAGAADGDAEAAAEEASKAMAAAEERMSTAKVRLADDDTQQERVRGLRGELVTQQRQVELWGALAGLIGSADGKKFRVFAQSLTFDSLISLANTHLIELARRYQLMRVPGTDLDLQIIDREMADEVRPTTSLSGGESFLISLALALALSSLGSRDTRVETLFIDEGFGTLDTDALEMALAALDALQGTGRQVGLISHIPGLVERLGAHVRIQPQGAGRSSVQAFAG